MVFRRHRVANAADSFFPITANDVAQSFAEPLDRDGRITLTKMSEDGRAVLKAHIDPEGYAAFYANRKMLDIDPDAIYRAVALFPQARDDSKLVGCTVEINPVENERNVSGAKCARVKWGANNNNETQAFYLLVIFRRTLERLDVIDRRKAVAA
jgi:hypothetical protein